MCGALAAAFMYASFSRKQASRASTLAVEASGGVVVARGSVAGDELLESI